jgi:hypothetical protein
LTRSAGTARRYEPAVPPIDLRQAAPRHPSYIGSVAHDKTVSLLTEERPLLERGARLLLEKEMLTESGLAEFRKALADPSAA